MTREAGPFAEFFANATRLRQVDPAAYEEIRKEIAELLKKYPVVK